jgi:sugar transferase (PEP-CTERM system associated)
VIRLFNVHYPLRVIVLLAGEAFVVCASFLLGTLINLGPDSYLVLNYESGFLKIVFITATFLLLSHYFDLYDPQRLGSNSEIYFRLFAVVGAVSFLLAGVAYLLPGFLLGKRSLLLGLLILTVALPTWRSAYSWLVRQRFLRERVYVLGTGERAEQLVQNLRESAELGMDVVGWAGAPGTPDLTREAAGNLLLELLQNHPVDRVIVAMSDRRGTIPVEALLELKIRGVRIEDATGLLEKTSGKIGIDGLYPSWLIFRDGFNSRPLFLVLHRLVSMVASLALSVLSLPLLPLIAFSIKISSPGPVLYRQKRVGKNGTIFTCLKFRTMRRDAEADTGPTWAGDEDPRITRVGRVLRLTRLDEIPQLWNVLRGDIAFVGPRPERPEFVEWLAREIPYYGLRHIIAPGITGWAQIRYQYGSSVEDAKEKLQYDLFYIKNRSIGLDLWILFDTVKICLLGRGARPMRTVAMLSARSTE